MIPIEKVQDIIAKHDNLEKELSAGNVEAKLFAKKSKEYSNLGNIITIAREYVNFENEKRDLDQIINDKNNDNEMIEMAKKDLNELIEKREKYENRIKIFLLPLLKLNFKNPARLPMIVTHNIRPTKLFADKLRNKNAIIAIIP